MHIVRIKVSGPRVRIKRVTCLVIARFVLQHELATVQSVEDNDGAHQSAEIVPNFRNVGIESDRPGVRIQCVAVLVNLVIEYTDRAPKGWVATISIYCLLIGFVGFGILLL